MNNDALTITEQSSPTSAIEDPRYASVKNWIEHIYDRGSASLTVNLESPRAVGLQDAIQSRSLGQLKKSSRVVGLRLFSDTDQSGMAQPEFDLEEAAAVFDAEPYVRKSIDRQLNLWFKHGFEFLSNNDRLLSYIVRRFRDIAFVSGMPTLVLFKTIVRDLLKFSNAFVVKVRDPNLSSGAKRAGRLLPIAGYAPVSALNMFPKFEKGKLVSWRRFINAGQTMIDIPVANVIHFTIDREPDFLYGKPRTLGVVEDVAALRRIEENVEVLLVKYLFPLFQFTVGTETDPAKYYPDGTNELNAARGMLQDMEQEGLLIGTERHKLDIVGAKNQAIDAKDYLQHFKSRLFSGLGVSALDLGEGDTANRSTADNISQNLKELVIETQHEFAAQVQQFMIAELFMENPEETSALNAYSSVILHFHDPDLDSRLKWQNHVVDLWNNDLITETEARDMIGLVPMAQEERAETRFSLVDVPLALISAVDEPFTKEAKAAVKARTASDLGATGPISNAPKNRQGTGGKGGGAPGEKKTKKPGSSTTRGPATKARPQNQHGKMLGPTKRKSSYEVQLIGDHLADLLSILMLDVTRSPNDVINERFQDKTVRKQIKLAIQNVIDALETHTINTSDIRAALVAEFMPLKEIVEEKADGKTN